MEELNFIIGQNLSNIRKKRNLSLEDLSSITRVSKAMLGQIERGKSNPTVSTLWKIATGLKVPFSSFLEKESIDYEVINCYDIAPICEENGTMKIYPIFPFNTKKNFEILTIELEKGCVHSSEKHDEGVEEYLIITEGTLEMDFGREQVTLKKGYGIRFIANTEHNYKNVGLTKCIFQNIIVYN